MNKIRMKSRYVLDWLAINNKTQAWLANVLQVQKMTLSQVLSSQRCVSPRVRQKLMNFFNEEARKSIKPRVKFEDLFIIL